MSTPTPPSAPATIAKYLSFRLRGEEYGVEILRVREIIGVIDITPLPRTPEYVKGVINLRGKIIPVLSLRARFGLPDQDFTDQTCIIVIEMPDAGGDRPTELGMIVDSVSEVVDVAPGAIDPTPRLGGGMRADHIAGLAKIRDRVVALLNIDAVIPASAGAAHAAEPYIRKDAA